MATDDQRHLPFLTHSRSRRAALHGGGALLAALGSFSPRQSAVAQATPTAVASGGGVLLVQSFGRGSLFPTQGDAGVLPFTVILWDAADRGVFFADCASAAAGVVPTESVLSAIAARGDYTRALLIAAYAAESDADTAASQAVWALRIGYGALGSDPGAVTYQGDPLPDDEGVALLGAAPAALPDGPTDLGAGYLIIAGLTGVDTGGEGVRLSVE